MSTAGVTRATLMKDLRMEWRSKDAINSMLFFALLVVVIFSFAFNPTAEESRHIAGGLIWVSFSVCRGGRTEPDMGPRVAQSGAGRVPRVSRSAQRAVSGQGVWQLPLRSYPGMPDGAAVRYLL
jgi:hypothetical protein